MLLNGRQLDGVEGTPLRILLSIEDVTERLRSRRALRASEIRYRRLFEAAKDGVLIVDPETRQITDVNPFLMQLLGFRRDEFVGKELFEIGLFSDKQAAQGAFVKLRETQQLRYDDLPLKGKDGRSHPVEVVANLYDEDGRAVIQCNIRDITVRKGMEQALRKSEARLNAIVTQAAAGISELDLDGHFILANKRFCHMVGRTAEQLRSMSAHEITHPDDQAATLAHFADRPDAGADVSMEKRYVRPDGSDVWVSNSGAWIAGSDDRPASFVQISQDISDRKKLETALHTSEAYFRELTESLPIGVWTSLPDGRVDFINRHWLELVGKDFTGALSHPEVWVNAMHPDDRAAALSISSASKAKEESYSLEARFLDAATGRYRWFLKHSIPVRDLSGRVQKRIGVCMDVDDLKRAQGVLADHAGVLTEQVEARTAELVETIGELEAFSYSVSHDMRAPLRAMQGFSRLLLEKNSTTLDAESLDQLRRIAASAARMDALINDVLTYSRLLRSEIPLQSINLDDLVRSVVATYPQLHAPGVDISLRGPLPTVLANEASLTQCLSNLLSNAVKFIAPGSTARVRVHADEIEGQARLWIEDNGIGIEPADQERIWNIFTQVGQSKSYQGTGIGLAIVRKAIHRMNGTTGVESALGQGSKFWIRMSKGGTP